MKSPSDRRAGEAAASLSQSETSRAGRLFWGLLAIAIGGTLAIVMTGVMAVAMFQGVLEDDFFGVSVAGMVVIFGAQLVKLGYDKVRGRQKVALDPNPLDALWHSSRPVHSYLPYSRLEIRGR